MCKHQERSDLNLTFWKIILTDGVAQRLEVPGVIVDGVCAPSHAVAFFRAFDIQLLQLPIQVPFLCEKLSGNDDPLLWIIRRQEARGREAFCQELKMEPAFKNVSALVNRDISPSNNRGYFPADDDLFKTCHLSIIVQYHFAPQDNSGSFQLA